MTLLNRKDEMEPEVQMYTDQFGLIDTGKNCELKY